MKDRDEGRQYATERLRDDADSRWIRAYLERLATHGRMRQPEDRFYDGILDVLRGAV